MLNQYFIIQNIKIIQKNIKNRILSFNDKYFFLLYWKKKQYLTYIIYILTKKKKISKNYLLVNNYSFILVYNIKKIYNKINNIFKHIKNELNNFLLLFPNLVHKSVPITNDKIIKRYFFLKKYKTIKKKNFNQIFFETKKAAQISSKKFSILEHNIATLHRSLIQFMLDTHIQKNKYMEYYMPLLVNTNSLYLSAHLPKFYKDQFKLEKNNLWLSPTSEIQLINYHRNKIYKKEKLPIKMVCLTTCFRKEIGNYGKDTKNLIRQHQFEKVELVKICKNTNSNINLKKVKNHAEIILKKLKIPYQIKLINSKDIGFTAAKTYDIEAWLPKTKKYLEVSSCSNTTNFQAQRLNIFWKNKKKKYLAHVINGSGLAVGRTLIALIENYQIDYNKILIPQVLQKYIKKKYIVF